MNIFEKLLTRKELPEPGICGCMLKMANNREKEVWDLINLKEMWCWGFTGEYDSKYLNASHSEIMTEITPLRQTMLMLCNEIYKDTYDKKRKTKNL